MIETQDGTSIGPKMILVDKIVPMRLNCNRLDDETFAKLVEDIREHDLRYAVLVRQVGPDRYQLVDGEHRWRAVKQLGGTMIKAEIVDMDEDKAQITNVRLNMERGHLDLVKLAEVFSVEKKKGHSEAEIGRGYGFSQQRISQILAIIGYSEGMKRLLTTRVVGEGHTRAIVGGIKDQKLQLQVADEVIKRRLSTRETEELIRELKGVKKGKRASKKSSEVAELSPTMPSATAVSVTLAGTAPNAPNTALTDTDATAARQTTGDVDAKIPQSPANPGVGTQNPSQLRHDFVDRITPIEFAIRGVKMQETIGSVTVVLLSYLRYLGGEEWADMSMGDCIDFIVRRFCHEHDIDLRIRRILPEDDIGKSSQEGAGSRNKFTI